MYLSSDESSKNIGREEAATTGDIGIDGWWVEVGVAEGRQVGTSGVVTIRIEVDTQDTYIHTYM